MSKELTPLEALEKARSFRLSYSNNDWLDKEEQDELLNIIETALKDYEKKLEQAQEDKEMLDIFKNALTVERNIPPELEIKESEKGCSYVFKEAVKIHENRIEEMLKKSLREWVLKNAFPKELKALEIIKDKRVNVRAFLKCCHREDGLTIYNNQCDNKSVMESKELTQEEYDLLKEVLL